MPTELLYLDDQEMRAFEATVTGVRDNAITLDRTAFYATGGGQPFDTGTLSWEGSLAEVSSAEASLAERRQVGVVGVRKDGLDVWHTIEGDVVPDQGQIVQGVIDWQRRHRLMRTHTALHILCGVIWNEWGKAVTGGNMEPLEARMDFEFDPLPEGFGARIEDLVNAEIAADRPIEVYELPRDEALKDDELIRTKVSLIPESVRTIRVVDIVGLDKQADGGTHVRSTSEVGRVEVVKTESKGKANKRVRIRLHD